MDVLQQQAKALGDPTRHAMFRYVADAGDAVDVAELTRHFGLNHNAIRQHLAKLVEAGLVGESTAPAAGRGRPRLVYRPSPAADSRWGVAGPYERLSWMLTEIIRTGDSPVDVGRRAVERQRLGPVHREEPFDALTEQMARIGFEPELRRRGDRATLVLRHCPFASAAMVDPDTVCSIHLGMAYGVAKSAGGELVIDDLVPNDPRQGACRLHCHVTA
jgi:predicted ArsR family transcriptional regulator